MVTDRNLERNLEGAWPRWVSLLLGIWLFISAFAWPHAMAQQTNTWIVGVLMVIVSILAMFAPQARFINTVLAIWLFVSTLVMAHQTTTTVWNNCIVAIVVFALSLVPSGVAHLPGGRRPVHA
jgi:SPW repeat